MQIYLCVSCGTQVHDDDRPEVNDPKKRKADKRLRQFCENCWRDQRLADLEEKVKAIKP